MGGIHCRAGRNLNLQLKNLAETDFTPKADSLPKTILQRRPVFDRNAGKRYKPWPEGRHAALPTLDCIQGSMPYINPVCRSGGHVPKRLCLDRSAEKRGERTEFSAALSEYKKGVEESDV